MRPSSAKAKGRKLQQWVVEKLVEILGFNVWKAMEQCQTNCKKHEPLVIIKRNNSKPLALVDAEYFITLHEKQNEQ